MEGIILRSVLSPVAGRGVAASLLASVLFGAISLIGGHLDGFGAEETTAWRVLFILLALLALTVRAPQRAALVVQVKRIARSPKLVLTILVTTAIMWLQLWVFMWGPAHGHTQDVAFGYFLLPLVMVLVGRVFFHESLNRLQWGAVIAAGIGVLAQLFIAGGISWPVGVIAGLYPLYFTLKRRAGLDSMQVFLIEIALLLVPAVIVLVFARVADPAGALPPSWALMLLMSVLSAVAMICYILASRLLPLSLFGLLSYVEPVIVLGVAVLLGEALGLRDLFVYLPIVIALVLLSMSGRGRSRRRPRMAEPPL